MTRILVLLTAALVLTLGLATPAAAEHPCLDDGLCPPHEDPPHPKDLIQAVWDRAQCLLLTQPPTACV